MYKGASCGRMSDGASQEGAIRLLSTKLNIPPLRPTLVSRPRLIAHLNQGLELGHILTLVSAPAGFGKSTLVGEWIAHLQSDPALAHGNRIAWFALDERDNELARFLAYLIAAIDQASGTSAAVGKAALAMLHAVRPPPAEDVLTALINDIAAISHNIILVLDDYHLVDSAPVDSALTYLLEHLPPQMHLVIATRVDPNLPISRQRARGALTELRATDLRFNSFEATAFFNQVMGLNLAAEEIAALETRTEGWISGLQLAALALQGSLVKQGSLSLKGQADTAKFIKSFTGSHRLVLDYLIEEVLYQQAESIQSFMLQTSILSRLSGDLCNAVTGQKNGQQTLELLEHANLFVVPLDNERHWYRYHHLFAELLRQRLEISSEHQPAKLHVQASKWYERHNLPEEAIEHALQGQAFDRAANLIAKEAELAWERNEEITLRKWLDQLPEGLVFSNPQLWMFHAWRLFITGQRRSAEVMLEEIERTLNEDGDSDRVFPMPESFRLDKQARKKLQGRIETARAYIAAFEGDEQGFLAGTQRALDYLPENDLAWRSMVTNSLADIYYFSGDMNQAYRIRQEGLDLSQAAGNSYQIMLAHLKLAVTLRMKGQLQAVLAICQQQDRIAQDLGMSSTVVAGYLLAIWGEALAEVNDRERALQKALRAVELTENRADVATLGFSYVLLIRVLFSSGELDTAEQIVRKMETVVRELDMLPWIMDRFSGWKIRVWLQQNKVDDAILWVKERNLDLDQEITSVNEASFLAFARVLRAQHQLDESLRLLQQLWERAEGGGRTSMMIETLILQAIVLQQKEASDEALGKLRRALTLAEPGGFIRTFVDEGPPLARLLYEALNRGIAAEYVRRLLAAFSPEETGHPGAEREPFPITDSPSPLLEPLSDRELEVLQLIAEGLANREIAERLYLSLNTVKVHARNIYGKLGVHNRVQAVVRARELAILPPV